MKREKPALIRLMERLPLRLAAFLTFCGLILTFWLPAWSALRANLPSFLDLRWFWDDLVHEYGKWWRFLKGVIRIIITGKRPEKKGVTA